MNAEELNLATELSLWTATVQARLSRRRALKRMRKAPIVHNFGACLCGCSDHLWERDDALSSACPHAWASRSLYMLMASPSQPPP